jgi:23S rRNA-/tRNA-specific pseudouridylate synthase
VCRADSALIPFCDRVRKRRPADSFCEAPHRLDMETSGVSLVVRPTSAFGMLVLIASLQALKHEACSGFGKQFSDREAKKTYIAIVDGKFEETSGHIDLPLRPDKDNRPKQMVDLEKGKASGTNWRVLEVFKFPSNAEAKAGDASGSESRVCDTGDDAGSGSNATPTAAAAASDAPVPEGSLPGASLDNEWATVVELTPITGRTHQLRVHMSSIGHPILGDTLYAHESALLKSPRLLLHAYTLTVRHPACGKELSFTARCEFFPRGQNGNEVVAPLLHKA